MTSSKSQTAVVPLETTGRATPTATKAKALSSSVRQHQAGVTLIELLIAISIFTLVITTAFGLMEVARAGRSTINRQVENIQGVRSSLDVLGRDVLNAGYGDFRQSGSGALMPDDKLSSLLGLPAENPANTMMDNLPTIIPGDNVTTNSLSNLKTDQITFLYQDINFNGDRSLTVGSGGVASDGSSVTVQSNGNQCRINDLIIISNSSTSAIGTVTAVNSNSISFQTNDLLGLNIANSTGPIAQLGSPPATFTRVTLITYRVLSDGTFVRTVHGNNSAGTTSESQNQDTPMVYGVENLVIEYVLANGQVSSNPPLTSMQNVRQVRVALTVQSSQRNPQTNQPQRLTEKSTFSTRNLSYERR